VNEIPRLHVEPGRVVLSGCWTLAGMLPQLTDLQTQLAEQSIATMVHYPLPPHRQPAYHELAERRFPAAEALAAGCLSLPISPTLTPAAVERIGAAIRLSLQAS